MAERAARFDTGTGRFKAADFPYAYGSATPLAGKELVLTGTTNSSGQVTFTLPTYFTTVHGAWPTVVRNSASPANACFPQVMTLSTTSVLVQVFESKNTGVLIGGVIEGLEASGAGITVTVSVKGV